MSPDLQALQGTAAELLAYTICKLFPDTQLLSGGVNEFGFYYDFVLKHAVQPHLITIIEEAMRGIAKEGHSFSKREMMRENAADFFSHQNQWHKAELVSIFPSNIVQLIELNGFFDVSPNYLTETTDAVKAFKIFDVETIEFPLSEDESVSAVRLSGIAFHDKQELKRFVKLQKLENKQDHRRLVEKLELFAFIDSVNPLSHCWLPKGMAMREILLDFWRKETIQRNSSIVETPELAKTSLLPGFAHAQLFNIKLRCATELPIRFAEIKHVHTTHFLKTKLGGTLKTPTCLTDLTHIFCTFEQVEAEVISSLQFIDKMVTILGFRCQWVLSFQEAKRAGTQKQWDRLLEFMRQALNFCGFSYNEETHQKGLAGPKIEARLLDLTERCWPGPEVGANLSLPFNLGLKYTNSEGLLSTPVVLQQSVFGSIERLITLLVEKNDGVLPSSISPENYK